MLSASRAFVLILVGMTLGCCQLSDGLATPASSHPDVECYGRGAGAQALAAVRVRGSRDILVQRLEEVDHPVTLCRIHMEGAYNARFASPGRLSFLHLSQPGNQAELLELDLHAGTTRRLAAWADGDAFINVHSWNAAGDALSYVSSDADGVYWRLQQGASDRVLATMPPVPGGTANTLQEAVQVGFSPDGAHLSLVDVFAPATQGQVQVRTLAGLSEYQSDGIAGTWSPVDTEFYSLVGDDVQRWTPGHPASIVFAGLHWVRPVISRDGGRLAYTVLPEDGLRRVRVVRPVSSQLLRELPPGAGLPRFLTPTTLWYREYVACTAATPCPAGRQSGHSFALDLSDPSSKPRPSDITEVLDSI